jgi:DNA-binding response OmpR family regulator
MQLIKINPITKTRSQIVIIVAIADTSKGTQLGMSLFNLGFRVTQVHDGTESLNAMRQPHDLLILSADLPGISGLSLLDDVRHGAYGSNPYVPVIILFDDPDKDRVTQAAQYGANTIITAETTIAQIEKRVNACLFQPTNFIKSEKYFGPERKFKN